MRAQQPAAALTHFAAQPHHLQTSMALTNIYQRYVSALRLCCGPTGGHPAGLAGICVLKHPRGPDTCSCPVLPIRYPTPDCLQVLNSMPALLMRQRLHLTMVWVTIGNICQRPLPVTFEFERRVRQGRQYHMHVHHILRMRM